LPRGRKKLKANSDRVNVQQGQNGLNPSCVDDPTITSANSIVGSGEKVDLTARRLSGLPRVGTAGKLCRKESRSLSGRGDSVGLGFLGETTKKLYTCERDDRGGFLSLPNRRPRRGLREVKWGQGSSYDEPALERIFLSGGLNETYDHISTTEKRD